MFFNSLKYFNNKKEINAKFITKVEKYFDYRWKNDKNVGFAEEDDIQLIECLPGHTKDFLISSYLWDEFLFKFRTTL